MSDINKPIQYQKGYCEFYKLKFKVTPDVLIPRPETELLVDEVVAYEKRYSDEESQNQLIILDIGTGSGNIAISLAKNLPEVKIMATDVSEKALRVARENGKLHQVDNQITFLKSDLLLDLHQNAIKNIDIIITNLPYIPTARIDYLDSSVKDFEPHIALDGGEDGFELYRKLFTQIREKELNPKFLIGEIDYTHGELARNEALKFFPKSEVDIRYDLAKKQRIMVLTF